MFLKVARWKKCPKKLGGIFGILSENLNKGRQVLSYLELAVLALARIMCAYSHSIFLMYADIVCFFFGGGIWGGGLMFHEKSPFGFAEKFVADLRCLITSQQCQQHNDAS